MAAMRRVCAVMLLLALSSAGVLGGDMPNALCGPGKYKYCIEAVGYDQATGETYVKDMDDGMCLSYNGDFTFTKVDCVTELASATKFIWDTPAANNLQAIYPAATETLCLHVYFGITMKTCENDVTFIQQQWAPHWKASYDGCVDMKAGNTVGNQCPCRPQANKVMGAVESLTVYQNCMSGRVRGATGARTLTSMRPENFCNGQPAPLQTLADWNDPNSMFVYWQEDTQDFTTAATYVTKVTYSDTEATIGKELKLPGCVQGGNIIRGKGDKLAMLCAEYDVAWGGSVGNLKIVEVEYDLSKEVRRFTVLPDEVIAANGDEEGKYPFQKGADFRYLEWVPTKNWYVAFYNAGWGIHVADEMRMYDADTETWVRGAGSGWACQNGHTQTGRMVYNADLDELAALCCSDSGGQCTDPADSKQACDAGNVFKNGMTMRTHVNSKIGPIALAPFSNVYSQAIGGWLGDIVPCGDGFAVVWVGPEEYDSYGTKSNNVGFMRVTVDGTITLKTWPTGLTPTLRARSAKLAKLGTGDCDRFLLGWGDMDTDHFYPNRYQLVELDGDGKQITTPFEVTSMTQWAEETVWTTTSTGDVVWAHTWKRNIDGSPNLVGRTAHGTQSGKGNTCTYDEGGYGYSWGSDPSSPGRRFHTNEAFFMRYKANEVQILDECLEVPAPCGVGQTCADPNTSPTSIKDFTCTCDDDMAVFATGAAATCAIDECVAAPCGTGQTCNDPDTKYGSQHDFVCTCDNDAAITNFDGPATCFSDECLAVPCGMGQTCNDPNPSPGSIKDFTCTCDDDMSVFATGTAATCAIDECTAPMMPPCGTGQTCNDPDTKYASQHDFVCTCDNDAALTNVDGPATCSKDECTPNPCSVGQTCNDPNPSPGSIKDFTCTCDDDMAVFATGTAATCAIDECTAPMMPPCGTGQTCSDPDTKYGSQHDFVCTCDNDAALTNVDGPATCSKDECTPNPCSAGQTCNDPNPSPGSIKDFTCTCDDDMSVFATGTAATCAIDECTAPMMPPCGTGQTCNDPDTKYASQHDFVCTCDNDATLTNVDGPATCSKDECTPNPCSVGQTCNDPNPSPGSIKDFTCTCDDDMSVFATGTAATCAIDECTAPMMPPCGTGQTCNDPDTKYGSQHDFVCTCDNDATLTNVDGPATCSKDECTPNPCSVGQTCNDPNPSPGSIKDFTCTCDDDMAVFATGTAATCAIDECTAPMVAPCGTGQTCNDPDTKYASQHDFVCTCDNDADLTNVDGPATCSKDECTPNPCSVGQTCNDPNPSPGSIKDFTCTCDNDVAVFATGAQVAMCEVDECATTPCGAGQSCVDADTKIASRNDFVCTCSNDAAITQTGSAAMCTVDECLTMPCGTQKCTDTNNAANSLTDFECECANGVKNVGGPATCMSGSNDECLSDPCSGQTCVDPDTTVASTLDYLCTCVTGTGSATGMPAVCVVDECETDPCGSSQDCADPVQTDASKDDFECSCRAPAAGKMVGALATCEVDECLASPCAVGQTCLDANKAPTSVLDFTCTCDSNGVQATGGAATCEVDECVATPCGTGQTCNDPDTSYVSQHDFMCTCDNDAALTKVDGPATCFSDECRNSPCAMGQTCNDPNPARTSLKDFTCTCDSNGVQATGGAATCEVDECVATPCGTGQTCNDPDMSYMSQHDFVCTCDNDAALTKVDGPATCFSDECRNSPCAMGQTCNDPNPARTSLKDFTCTCDSNGVQATGGAATCEVDECVATPCGTGQTCNDPDTSYLSQHDFMCTCDNDAALTKVDGPATCFSDECRNSPCAMGQTCNDPNPARTSLKDFTCTCDSNGVQATGGAATCEVDECVATPCGTGQTCNDPDMSYMSQHDFVCTCDNDAALTKVDGPATCFSDECRNSPCAMGQTCNDPNPARTSLKDFTCTCDSNGVQATGGAATCEVDECVATPCGTGQTCNDPDMSYMSQHDFVCTCDNDASLTKVDGPATCFSDECRNSPCGMGQTCSDPNPARTSLKDFTCTCDSNGVQATGGSATCEEDECTTPTIPPCGMGQTCNDPDTSYLSKHDFVCTCDNVARTNVDGPARCFSDECRNAPCGSDQKCEDPNQGFDTLKDFTCTCANGVQAVGGAATCELDECEKKPCGADQTCVDDDTRYTARRDYMCACVQTGTKARGQPANCDPRATSEPGIDTLVPVDTAAPTFPPNVVPTLPPAVPETFPPNVPETRVPMTTEVTGRVNQTVGGGKPFDKKEYKRIVSEKTGVPEDEFEVTTTTLPDGSIGVGTTFTGDNGAGAQKALEEAHKNPTQDLKDLGFTTLGGAEEETPAPEDDDSGMPWWVWLLAGLGVVGCAGALAAGARKKMGNESVSLDEFMDTQHQAYGDDGECMSMHTPPPKMEMASI